MDNMNLGYNAESSFAGETRSPYINELIQLVVDIRTGRRQAAELQDALDSLKEMIEVLSVSADALKATQPASENFEAKFARMQELFGLLLEEFGNMELYLETPEDKYLDEPIENIKKYIAEVLDISDEFRKVEESQPLYSHSVLINDVIRVGRGFADGSFELIQLKARVEAARVDVDETYTQMQALADQPHDTKALADNYPRIMELIETMVNDFNELENYCVSGDHEDRQFVVPFLDQIQASSAEIFEIQQKIVAEMATLEEDASKRICPRCGQKTSVVEKYCEVCKAVIPPLPQATLEHTGELSFVADDGGIKSDAQGGGVPSDQRLVSPNVLKIYEAAFNVGQGNISKEEFAAVLDWYDGLLQKTKQDMGTIKEPDNLTEDERALFNQTFNLLIEGLEESQNGLNELREYFNDGSIDHLVNGVNTIIDAGDKLYGVQAVGEAAQQKMNEMSAEG